MGEIPKNAVLYSSNTKRKRVKEVSRMGSKRGKFQKMQSFALQILNIRGSKKLVEWGQKGENSKKCSLLLFKTV